jgi:calcium-dependent protein kinase
MGQGHSGEVRKCKNKKTGLVRAVKILRKDKLDQKATDRFLHEIKVYKKLDHPNILKVYEFYEDEKRYYLVSELCTGGELFDEIIQKKYFTEYDAAHIIK